MNELHRFFEKLEENSKKEISLNFRLMAGGNDKENYYPRILKGDYY